MPGTDSYGQGVNLALLTDAPDAQVLASDLANGLLARSLLRYDSAAHRGATLVGLGAAHEGLHTYLKDVDRIEFWNGSAWKTLSDWAAYTPTWSASSGTVGIGNGFLYGRWTKIGKTVHARFSWACGSTTLLGTGGTPPSYGAWSFSLPTPAASDTIGEYDAGGVTAYRPNVAWYHGRLLLNPGLGTVRITHHTQPWVWGNAPGYPYVSPGPQANDAFYAQMTYEAAS